MDRLKELFDLRGLKVWMLVLGFALNLILTFLLFTGLAAWLNQRGGWTQGVDLSLMLGEIFISGLIGFGVTLLARDRRGPSYGLLRAIDAFVLVIILMYQSGFLALIVGLTALLGGYNGGMLGERVIIGRQR